MNREKCFLSIVVPVFNEERSIDAFVDRTVKALTKIGCLYEIIFVLDPSDDNTENVINAHIKNNKSVKLIRMSRRFGQPTCTFAGIRYCTGDACVVIDVDLQDPPELIEQMVEKWKEGYDVVYAQRASRKGETLIKRIVSYAGYMLIDKISDIRIPRNTGDFRLISRRVINNLKTFKEHEAFLRGLVAYVGFNQTSVLYNRDERKSGSGKYNRLLGSLQIGLNGVLGFSKYPLHIISILGLLISGFSFLLSLAYFVLKLVGYDIKWGNPTLVILMTFLSGIQLLSLGIIGQYFARIFDEVKNRPTFIIDKTTGFDDKNVPE